MDDILIHGKSQEEHNRRLESVLTRLKKHGLVLNESKCSFSTSKVKFLGHIIENETVKVDPERIEALKKFPTPKSIE